MASDGLRSNTETLRTEGGNFVALGKDFQSAVNRMINGLSALGAGPPAGNQPQGSQPPQQSVGEQFWSGLASFDSKAGAPPWGDDEIGEKFGVAYEGLRDGMYESMGHLCSKLQEIGKALESMAKNHEANEDFNELLMKQHVRNQQAEHQAIAHLSRPHH
ncbi:hypothetical protein [Streptomyces meridianus]|uniref:Uncharacterized protein n=1 Tax=Streptomyces meridianus TaxID=2938945 RepID=A0ABT0XD54_9ACTN|nr:hypothetical protein [Streptomyces meridianus]MCM2579858.1 hypothetical protein [Streptomyces meridianus]